MLPVLPDELRIAAAVAAWGAASAALSMYATPATVPSDHVPTWQVTDPAEAFDHAARHGDEHAIKLADTVLSAHEWSADPSLLRAIVVATRGIPPVGHD